ncbi:bifunctional histidinol-phosphatase/imidazoleglycerol-phosphate dehydratase, partial [Xanthomonas perforans]|nr:bifunctional histidinol-phosphatase/imidazoleglycerol-phosphate dehydratase [Xanthomonas perforans]
FQLRTDEFGGEWDWPGIAHELADAPRRAVVQRNTKETRIRVELDLDRVAEPKTATGLPFFDHMLEQIGKHGGFALEIRAEGDLHIDEHHTIEDTGLALGQALREALGDKRGIGRYGFDPESSPWRVAGDKAQHGFTLPMDETIASAALDFSGRPYFVFDGEFKRERVGDMPTELVPHFFRSICDASGLNLHLTVRGENDHHKVEACFKALARALRQAIRREGTALPTTKGAL